MGANKERIKKVLEIRRSNAAGPIKSKKEYDRKKEKIKTNKLIRDK